MQRSGNGSTGQLALAMCLIFAAGQLFAQNEGASQPKPLQKLTNKKEDQYKRIHQYALRKLEQDQPEAALETLRAYLKDHPNDAESRFLMGLHAIDQEDYPTAIGALQAAVRDGLPIGRIIAGPRELFAPIASDPFYKKIGKGLAHEPIHGPLLGNVTDQQACVWVRTVRECDVRLRVSTHVDMRDAIVSRPDHASAENDFTAKPIVQGLTPSTRYHYQVEIDGAVGRMPPSNLFFTTFREPSTSGILTVAFGGGAGFVPNNERMWGIIRSRFPSLLLLLGDNVYIDDPQSSIQQRYTYYRRQSREEFRQLVSITPTYAIWDDHDFGTNDCWGGEQIRTPQWKYRSVWPTFCHNWPNPAYGGGPEQPGCWYAFRAGDIDFIMLDCRYYRTNPQSPNPSMLGRVQLEWLKQTLRKATGTFKVICSSVPWDYRTKGDSLDTWNGYHDERDEIFDFLNEQKTSGVILLSADRHRSDAWKIDNPNGYDFYEFSSSRLTNQHVHPEMKQALVSYNKKQSFGHLTFDTTSDPPRVTYAIINIDGKKVHELTVTLSDLGG